MTSLFDVPFEDEPGDEAAPPPPPRALTVSQVTAGIRRLLENAYDDLLVEGELSNCRVYQSGHLYFTLKDEGAQLRGVMFRSAARQLRFRPEDGARVLVRGRLSVYEPKGEYQVVAEQMDPLGLGALQLAFDQLRRRLEAQGLFDAARKRRLPLLPRRIGIVTSIDGAALRDVVKVLRGRYANVDLVVRPARVQGEGAAAEIARGLERLARVPGIDVIILARGGGSIEDLWAFNEEAVARAIAACPVPVITGIGHQTDFTIADFVADVRAATPSNAAEIVVGRKDEFVAALDRLDRRALAATRDAVARRRSLVHVLAGHRGLAGVPVRVALRGRQVADLAASLRDASVARLHAAFRRLQSAQVGLERLDHRRRLASARGRLGTTDGRLHAAIRVRHGRGDTRWRTLSARLASLSPLAVLGRGYALCWSDDGRTLLREADPGLVGHVVRVTLARGELHCEVTATAARTDRAMPRTASSEHDA